MSLKEELRKLSSKHRSELMLAFEQEIPYHVVVKGTFFIAVNLIPNTNFEILESQGAWSCGWVMNG